MDFIIRDSIRGKSYWKANVSVFGDKFFKEDLIRLWEQGVGKQSVFDLNWWVNMKVKISNLIRIYSFRLNYVRRGRIIDMCKRFNFLLSEEPRPYNKITDLGQEIDHFMESHLDGAKRRAKVMELNYKEGIMSELFKREKRKAIQKTMTQLESDSGEVLTNKNDMIDFVTEFYQNLYAEVPSDPAISDYFLKDRPKLTEEEKLACEGPFILEELEFAVKKSRGSTSPGVDGLPIEFYKSFFGLIGPRLIDVFNSMLREGQLGRDQNCAVVILLCKKPDAAQQLRNWRPISLLCNDIKLVTKILSIRLGRVMNSLIGEFQTSGVPGRQIFSNVHLIRNIAEYLNHKGKSAQILSMAQSKAFDRVAHKFLLTTLQYAGFGSDFISWIRLLYDKPTLRVSVNGQLTKKIPVKRGVRQGCSLSPLLYVLVMDSLLRRVHGSDNVQGVKIPGGKQIKMSAFADDTNFFCDNTKSVRHVLILFELFGLASGSVINFEKSFIMFLGPWKPDSKYICGIRVTNVPEKIYGIYFDNKRVNSKTWEVLETKLRERAIELEGLCRTLRGRLNLFLTLIASKIWYVATVCIIPKSYIVKFTRIMFCFICGGKDLRGILCI